VRKAIRRTFFCAQASPAPKASTATAAKAAARAGRRRGFKGLEVSKIAEL